MSYSHPINRNGAPPNDGTYDRPISDNSVSTTSNASAENEWMLNEPYGFQADQVAYYELDTEEPNAVGVVASRGGDGRQFRSKNVFRNNLKAIKTGLKTAAQWIPNIFNRTSPRNGSSYDKKSKVKLSRNDSINSSIHSNSYYSSVLGSENSNSQYTNNSCSTSSSNQHMYGQYQHGGGGGATVAPQMSRCTSYDPISVDGSSRRSSTASCTSLAAATVTSLSSRRSTQVPAHLNQTENLVIQPQSLALTTEQFVTPRIPPPPPMSVQPNIQKPQYHTLPSDNTSQSSQHIKTEIVDEQEMTDSMNNLILPDDMVC